MKKKEIKKAKCVLEISCECKLSINHISRIEGQIKTLKKYIENGKGCEDVAMLTTSITKSFESLKTRTLKNFLKKEILDIKKITKNEEEKIEKIFNLYKK